MNDTTILLELGIVAAYIIGIVLAYWIFSCGVQSALNKALGDSKLKFSSELPLPPLVRLMIFGAAVGAPGAVLWVFYGILEAASYVG